MKKRKRNSNKQQKQTPAAVLNKEQAGNKELIIILILFFAAFFIRCIYLYQAQHYAALSASLSDPASCDEAARTLVKEGKVSKEFFWHAPFYPFFLSLLYWLSGSSVLFAKIVQIVIGSLTVVFVYLTAKKFFKKETALTGAILAAVCFPLIFFEAEIFAEGLAGFFCVLLIYLFITIKNNPGPVFCYLSGLTCAASITTRPVFLVFFPAACAWCLWCWIKAKTDYKKIMLCSVMLILGMLTLLLPICFVNRAIGGEFTFLPFSGGINSFIGNNPDYHYTITIRPGYSWEQLLRLPASEGITGDYPQDRYFNGRVWDYIFSKPFDYIKGLLVKTVEFFSAREIPRTEDIYMFREDAPLLGIGVWKAGGFGFPFGILFPLALLGIWAYRKQIPGFVWCMLVFYPLAVILVFVSSRYRVPLLPVICMLSAGGIIWIYEQVKAKKWKSMGTALAVMVSAAFCISLPGPFIEEKMDLKAEYRLSEGEYYMRINENRAAVNAFRQALELEPCYAEAAYMLGSLYYQSGQYKEAEKELNRVLDLPVTCFFNHTGVADSDLYVENNTGDFKAVYSNALADTHKILGNIMLAENRLDDAVFHFQEVTALSPDNADVTAALIDIKLKQKQYQDALPLLKKAILNAPGNPTLYSQLGLAYKETGDIDNAVAGFTKAIALQPENPYNHFSLGNLYFDNNEIKKALENYQAVLKITPLESYTLYKLGLCYMKLGDKKSAAAAFIQSLQVKPGNPPVEEALKKVTGK